jgi:hypothetical protein
MICWFFKWEGCGVRLKSNRNVGNPPAFFFFLGATDEEEVML